MGQDLVAKHTWTMVLGGEADFLVCLMGFASAMFKASGDGNAPFFRAMNRVAFHQPSVEGPLATVLDHLT